LNEVALCRPVLAIDHLQDLARSNEVVACRGIGFIGGALGVGIRVVVYQILLDEDAQAIANLARG
jgi:hypothetical protein